jgi:uracil-DNA glycosylase family 4
MCDWSRQTGCDITEKMDETRPLNHDEMLAVLDWYRAAGVDVAVGEEPVDRFAQRPPARVSTIAPTVQPAAGEQRPMEAPVLGADPAEARSLAASAQSLDELQAMLGAYDGCGLKFRATQLVFADGNPEADVMLIGEAPGAEEDRQGKPFVGKSGQLLDRMLGAIGLDRSKVYIANSVPWRPPGNRAPTPEEMALCLPFLHRQVELVAPKLVMTLGGPAMQTVFETTNGIIKMRGKWANVTIGKHVVEAIPTLHPAYLLRNPPAKQQAWRDVLSLKLKMVELGLN